MRPIGAEEVYVLHCTGGPLPLNSLIIVEVIVE